MPMLYAVWHAVSTADLFCMYIVQNHTLAQRIDYTSQLYPNNYVTSGAIVLKVYICVVFNYAIYASDYRSAGSHSVR